MNEENKDKDVIFTTPAQTEKNAPAQTGNMQSGDASAQSGKSDPTQCGAELPPQEGKDASSQKKEDDAPDLKYKNSKEVAKGGILGFFIGLAVIVPGVSGSTVAIIFKLYDKLLYALGNIVRRFKLCAKFLLPIALGLIIGFVLGFLAIQQLIDISPFTIIGLFAGLMLGAFPAVYDEIRNEKKTPLRLGLFAIGLAVPIAIALVSVFVS